MIEMTPTAAQKVLEVMSKEAPQAYLRLYVAGRSCCSVAYGLALDEQPGEQDAVLDVSGVRLAVDPDSLAAADGSTIDYVESEAGTGFTVRNPNASGGCACGSR